jgi:alpha-beta hydrolase superfamily lysophospholipase
LAGRLWEAAPDAPAVLIVPGLGSTKDNHADMAGLLAARGLAALALDLRGHGESEGRLDAGCLDDVRAGLDALSARGHRSLGMRGSSMGGMLALAAAADGARVDAVVAICPARPDALADRIAARWPRGIDLAAAVSADARVARGFWHATGDDAVPWAHSFALAGLCRGPVRLHVAMGGGHRTLQHDPDIMRATADFLCAHLRA